jgi:pimeloyl-ACP methyl ester carboxylesterase
MLFDQRGSGRSLPLASDPDADLSDNTTAHLIADMEALRVLRGVERWTILGLSWGTTLGLAYAQTYPDRVDALVLAFVTTTSHREVQWITEDIGRVFREELWRVLGHGASLAYAPWPIFDPDLARDEQREYVVQLNGRIRHAIVADAEMGTDALLALVKADRRVKELLAGKQIVKEIAVPGRLVNFVVRE